MRKPEGFSKKVRKSITLDERVYNYHVWKMEKKGHKDFSSYIEDILKRS